MEQAVPQLPVRKANNASCFVVGSVLYHMRYETYVSDLSP